MPFKIIQLVLLVVLAVIFFKVIRVWFSELLSDTKPCPRCDGKGYWQNTRNREKCEWCMGSGRLPKNLEV